jgi:hypothetical protein
MEYLTDQQLRNEFADYLERELCELSPDSARSVLAPEWKYPDDLRAGRTIPFSDAFGAWFASFYGKSCLQPSKYFLLKASVFSGIVDDVPA